MLFTYAEPLERAEYARRCLKSLSHLSADEEIWIHIADDGSPQEFRDEIIQLARSSYGERTSMSNSKRTGYGGSYNLASQYVHQITDLVLPLEDDWEVARDFDLAPFAKALRAKVFQCIRMGYIGYTDTLLGRFLFYGGNHYLELLSESLEKHVFAGGPRLETVEFQRSIGPWVEKQPAGATELDVASRPESRVGVVWPVELIKPRGDLFSHIGTLKAGDGSPGSRSVVEEPVTT